ncbi:MAG: hypothetical protein ABSB18_03120 [Candidatus Omnitrophota bacterium]
MNFTYSNIRFTKDAAGNWLNVEGEIQNLTNKNYNAVAFRIVLFLNNTPAANAVLVINGFPAMQSRYFEQKIEELDYSDQIKEMLRCEIYPETAY